MRPHRWILKGKIPLPCDDLLEWARWIEESRKTGEFIVAKTDLDAELRVSTVFLGLDHSFAWDSPDTPPILFETMVFGEEKIARYTLPDGTEDTYAYRESHGQWRYSTWAEAAAGHEDVCKLMQAKLDEAHAHAASLVSSIKDRHD